MLTVVLTTWNGARTIGRTLDAFGRLRQPASPWRLIVIDGGSTDGTVALLERQGSGLPLTVLHDARPGPWAGINHGLATAGEGLVVFTDDDILPHRDWLRAFETAAAAHPDYALFAGRTLPAWDADPPAWIREDVDLAVCYGVHLPRPEGPCPHFLLYGANMAIRAEAIGPDRFDESYGLHRGGRFALCGETEFVGRLAKRGHKAWFCPDAVVEHIVPAAHMRADWLLRRAEDFGRGQFRVDGDERLTPRQGALRAEIARLSAKAGCRFGAGLAALRNDASARFRALWRLRYLAGYAAERRALRRDAVVHGGRVPFGD